MSTMHVIEMDHSELGPSSSDRWIHCPGSVIECRGIKGSSKYAAEGTAAHTVSEWVRAGRVPATTFLGVVLKVDGFEFKVGKAMARGVQEFVDYCAKAPGDPFYEIRVRYENYVPGGFGTADDVRLTDDVCVNTDLKYGTGVKVFAKENSQLKLYTLGTYEKYKWAYRFDKCVMRIAQPRLKHWDEWETTIEEIKEWANDVARPAALRALQPGAPFQAGNWCKFCKLRDTCQVRAEYKREKESVSRANDLETLGDLG